jgi:hypothetical protein
MAAHELERAVAIELSKARQLPVTELAALGETGKAVQIDVLGRAYEINTWSEPVPGDGSGAFAVLVGAWSRSLLGVIKFHFKGFIVAADGTRADIPEHDLWRYD